MEYFDLSPKFIDDNADLARVKVYQALHLLRSVAGAADHAVTFDKNILSECNDLDIVQTIADMEDHFETLLDLLQ